VNIGKNWASPASTSSGEKLGVMMRADAV